MRREPFILDRWSVIDAGRRNLFQEEAHRRTWRKQTSEIMCADDQSSDSPLVATPRPPIKGGPSLGVQQRDRDGTEAPRMAKGSPVRLEGAESWRDGTFAFKSHSLIAARLLDHGPATRPTSI